MTEGSINRVLYNVDQRADTTDAEKKTARDNIGAIGADEIPSVADDRYKLLQSPLLQTFAANAVIDRFEQNAQGVATIHCSYLTVATDSADGLMSASDKAKLNTVAYNAEQNVQADWNASSGAAEILNKPSIPELSWQQETQGSSNSYPADQLKIHQDYNTVTMHTTGGSDVQLGYVVPNPQSADDGKVLKAVNNSVGGTAIFWDDAPNADWNATSGSAEILNKPTIPDIVSTTTSVPPVDTDITTLRIFTDGRVHGNSSTLGCIAPEPAQSDTGKILEANWTGSPGIGTARWVDKPTGVPASVVADKGKVLTVNKQGAAEWQKREHYFAGAGITETTDLDTGNITFDWAYTVGRHLVVNSHDQLCVSMPGALDDASSNANNLFYPVTNGEFSGSYVLMTRQNASGTYDIGLRYTASGTSSTFSFVGTETVVANDNTITVNPAVYMGEPVTYSGNKFGTTTFNPTTHKAIYYSGLAMIGHISDTKIAIFKDADNNVKVAFTSMEGKLW